MMQPVIYLVVAKLQHFPPAGPISEHKICKADALLSRHGLGVGISGHGEGNPGIIPLSPEDTL